MELINFRMPYTLGQIELRALERRWIASDRESPPAPPACDTREILKETACGLYTHSRQLPIHMVREIHERSRGAEFLTHEQ